MQVLFIHSKADVLIRTYCVLLAIGLICFVQSDGITASGGMDMTFKTGTGDPGGLSQYPDTVTEACKPHEEELEAAEKLIKDNRWTQAEFVIRQVKAETPECPLVYLYLGRLEYYYQNDRRALSYFNRLAGEYPELYHTYHFRGLIYYEQSLELVALEEFHKTMIANPTIGSGYFTRTILPILEKGAQRDTNRIDSLLNAITIEPARELSRGFIAYFQDDTRRALGHFTNVVRLMPDHAGGWLFTGRCHEELGEAMHALNAYNQAIARDRSFAEAYLYRGLLKIDANNWYRGCLDLRTSAFLDNNAAKKAFDNYCRRRGF